MYSLFIVNGKFAVIADATLNLHHYQKCKPASKVKVSVNYMSICINENLNNTCKELFYSNYLNKNYRWYFYKSCEIKSSHDLGQRYHNRRIFVKVKVKI